LDDDVCGRRALLGDIFFYLSSYVLDFIGENLLSTG
jgi:hypothetical protein